MSAGWMSNTGSMPVMLGTPVDVRHRDGTVFINQKAGVDIYAQSWDFRSTTHPGDIMEWRLNVAEPQKKTVPVENITALRDQFAGQVLAAFIGHHQTQTMKDWGDRRYEDVAEMSYLMADAMLKARKA